MNINGRIKGVVGLSDADVAALQNDGITTAEDLTYVEFQDLSPGINVLKRRKLDLVRQFLILDPANKVTATMSIDDIKKEVDDAKSAAAAVLARGGGADVDKGAPKVYTDHLKEFSGDPIDYEDWEGASETTLKQTIYKEYLSRLPANNNDYEKARNAELFNMLLSAVRLGHARNIVEKVAEDPNVGECGHSAWRALKTWYMDPAVKRVMADHYTNKLDVLVLDKDISATQFMQSFDLYVRKIEKFEGQVWSEDKKIREFKKRIVCEDYDTEKRTFTGNTLNEFMSLLRKREQDLDTEAISDGKVQRRFKRPSEEDAKDQGGTSNDERKSSLPGKAKIPFIPNFLFRSLDKKTRKNIRKWRDLTNAGKTMGPEDMVGGSSDSDDKDSDSPPEKKAKKGKKQRRVTTTAASGLKDDVVEVKLDSGDEAYPASNCLIRSISPSFGDDSMHSAKLGLSGNDVKDLEKRIRRNTSVGMSRGRNTQPTYAVIDPGAEQDHVGDGWRVVHLSESTETLRGALDGMGSVVMHKVDAVTAVLDSNGDVHLIGVGSATWDGRSSQHESLINSHHVRSSKCEVNDVAKIHGGSQDVRLKTSNGFISLPLEFDGDTMKLHLREPTDEELATLGVVWLKPPMVNHNSRSIRRNRVDLSKYRLQEDSEEAEAPPPAEEGAVQEEIIVPARQVRFADDVNLDHWKQLLGFPSDEVVEKTIESTTQLLHEPVEMERREIPRQHRKKRLLPLHPKRLRGRVDADTFFSTVKSIRNYKCVQLFVHVLSDFIFIRCMQRESHSHGAYQDFVREVGAPEMIITDNSKTQTGKKWEATNRKLLTKQRKFAPHNQNQNKAERRIQDVKRKTMTVLYRFNAPLVFWCYCMCFIVDCMNVTAKRKLNWRTSSEILNGDTPDISVFRFHFWQPIEYYEPTARCPESLWKRGRFLGIAWDSGDRFTYIVWTEPDGDWKNGGELVRNIVRPRKQDSIVPEELKEDDNNRLSGWKFQKKVATRKRRSPNKTIYKYELQDLEEVSEDDDSVVDEVKDEPRPVVELFDPATFGLDEVDDDPDLAKQHDQGGKTEEPTEPSDESPPTTNNQPQSKTSTDSKDGDQVDYLEMIKAINDQFSRPDEVPNIGGSTVVGVEAHEWRNGSLQFKVLWSDGDTSWELLRDLREDHPRLVARYIVEKNVSRSTRGGDRVLQWAKKVIRDTDRAMRRIVRLYDFFLNDDDSIGKIRRIQKGSRKRKKVKLKPRFKYGIEVPRDPEHALKLDEANGNHNWAEAMGIEVDDLLKLDCFEFKEAGWRPSESGWQSTTLHMIFDVKHDLRHKARLVAGGHLVEVFDTPVYSSTVKSISVQLLHVIAHKVDLKQLCGDIGNAFVNAYTNEKVFVYRAGIEFGENAGKAIVIKKALYGLRSSAERFHSHLADTLRSFGFKQTRFDNDVWIRFNETDKMYEYVCTHVDDFMIVSRNPDPIMKEIESVYLVKDSSKGPPDYYLGNDYKKDGKGRWCIGCKKYLTEAIDRIEAIFGNLPKKDTPMVDGDNPELDTSSPLNDDDHRKYQMLLGMLNWIVCLGRIDVGFATSSLSRFTACPRKGHLDRALRVFGYLKKYKNRRIVVDSRDPILVGGTDALDLDFTEIFKEFYPDAAEEIDEKLPKGHIDELEITAFVDSDHAHDKVTRRSITGLLILVGRTPVFFMSKRQGAIETSTYGAEFCAMKTAVEEVIAVRYMLRCLGVKVKHASLVCGDNKGVIQGSTISDSLLKKKHVAIAYHKTREAAAAGIIHPIKIDSVNNFADLLTKALTGKVFWRLYGRLTGSY